MKWVFYVSNKISFFCRTMGSLAHIVKCSLGAGILAVPLAFKNSGILFGAIGTLLIGLICTHCVQILVSIVRYDVSSYGGIWKNVHFTFPHKRSRNLLIFSRISTLLDLFKVKTSRQVCRKAKVPSLDFAGTAEKVFETGPPGMRKYASFAR